MKIAICLQCDQKMKQLTNFLICPGCELLADVRLLLETRKCQAWEKSGPKEYRSWHRLQPYERKIPRKLLIYGFRANY